MDRPRTPRPRETLPGEYLGLLAAAHGGSASLWWLTSAPSQPASWLWALAGVWVVGRGVGIWRRWSRRGEVTAHLAALCWSVTKLFGHDLGSAGAGLFSPFVILTLLLVVFMFDLTDEPADGD